MGLKSKYVTRQTPLGYKVVTLARRVLLFHGIKLETARASGCIQRSSEIPDAVKNAICKFIRKFYKLYHEN